jgi:hypothetical protein
VVVVVLAVAVYVVTVSSYKSRGPGSIPGATSFFLEVAGLERDPLSFVSTTVLEEKVEG